MLEIFLLWKLATYIGVVAKQKGYKKLGFQVMAVLLWFCGEIVGSLVAYYLIPISTSFIYIYGMALIGAVSGAGLAFLVMKLLPIQAVEGDSSKHSVRYLRFIPLLISILALGSACCIFGGTIGILALSSSNYSATHLRVYNDLDRNGQIIGDSRNLSVDAVNIYLEFYLSCPANEDVPLDFKWYLNGDPIMTYSEIHPKGFVTTRFIRGDIKKAFPVGVYRVEIWHGKEVLNSIQFNVAEPPPNQGIRPVDHVSMFVFRK